MYRNKIHFNDVQVQLPAVFFSFFCERLVFGRYGPVFDIAGMLVEEQTIHCISLVTATMSLLGRCLASNSI